MLARFKQFSSGIFGIFKRKNREVSATEENFEQIAPKQIPSAKICVELFLKELAQLSVSQSTLRNYSSDILQFIDFSNDNNVKTLLTEPHFKAFFADQQMKGLKSSSIQRKIVSLKLFSQWVEKNYLSAQPEAKKEVIVPLIVNSGNSNGSSSQPLHSAADSSSATVQDKKGYQDWILGPYFHLATLIIFFIFISILWYRQFFVTVPEKLAYPATPVSPDRILSFQARLTDVAGTPITTATNTTFKLYDASSGGNLLWNSGTCSIDPDQDGIFSTILGSTCGSSIPATVFTENSQVWLEITVVSDVLTPRQRIATVPYALNSETIQGFPVNSTASATKSTVLVMNQWGEVLLGERSPLLKSVSGTFTISGSTLNLVTNSGSNGNIVLDPDGTGTINLNGNVLNDGYLFTHGATISATYAGNTPLTINGTGGQVMTVNNAGDVTTAGDVAVNGGDITSTGDITISPTGNNVLFSDNTVLNIGGAAAQAYNFFADSTAGNSTATGDNDLYIQDILEVDGAARFDSSVTLSTLNTAGGIVYTNGSGQLLTSSSGSTGDCLQSGGTGAPTWGTCSSGGLAGTWRIANGATSPVNDTLDLLIGSNATSSAKFAVINVNSGTPTASLSAGVAGGAYLTATGTLQTTANQALAIGGNTTGDISFSPLNGTGTSTFTGNLTQSGGIVNLNVSSNNAVNIATGTSTGTVTVGGTGTQTINVGNGAGNKTVNLGSNNGGSTTAILSGTGGLSLNSTSSDIALQTNTSGNITATTATGNGLLNVLTGNLKVGNGTPDVTLNGEDAYIEGTLETDGAVRFDNSSITLSSFTNNGGMLYTNGSGVLAQTTAGSAGQCLQGGTTPGFVDCTTIGSYWRLASGALSPINDTADLLVGANATTSAKFAVINVNSGTPTATLSAGVAGGSYLTAAGTLQTTANQTLTLGGSTTGDVAISPFNGAGGVNVNVGASRLLNVLTGNLKVGNGTPDVTQDGEDAYIEGTLEVDGAVRFDNSAVRLSAFTTNGGLLYTDGSGNIGQSTAGTAGQCLVSNGGGAPGWTSCSSGATNFWRVANGALSPVNDTLDLLVGNTATTSARFAVINVNSGTPTATLSAGVAGGAFLTADGSLQTTANQTLTLGGLTTGDIAISPLNGAGGVNVNLGATRLFNILSGNLKVGNGTPDVTQDGEDAYIEGSLEVDGAVRFDNSSIRMSTFTTDGGILYTNATGVLAQTTAGLSGQCLKSNGSGAPTFGTCATDNFWRINNGAISPVNDTLDLLIGNTATTSARFAVINVNSGTPTATLSAGVTGGAYLSATGTLQTTANQALAIGGNTTGDISFSPLNGTGTSTFTGNLTQSGGIVNLNVSSNNAVNIGTGSSTGTVTVGGTGTQTIAVGNGAGNKTVNLGSNNTGSTTAILSGTGGLSLNSTSSDIALQTNTSGNITATTAVGTGLFNVLTGNLKVGNGAPTNALSGESAYIEGGLEVDGAVRFDNSSITMSTFTQNGGMLYANGSGVLAQTTAGSAGQCLQGGTTPTFVTCTSIGSNWRIASGAISPNNETLDLLIGANATTSAKFAVINVNSGTPTATLSAGIAGGSYLTATGSLQTTANQTLTLGGSTTGDVAISPLNGAGGVNVNLGATRTINVLTGNLKVGNGNPDVAQDGEDAYIEGTLEVDGAVRFDNSSITMSTFTNNGGIIYTNASGVLAQTTVGSNGQCLQSVGGGTPTWGTCGSLVNYWRIANGALSPVNDTLDLLVGNTATTSAKFAVINVNSGTPTATLSAGITGGAYLNASGALQTTDNQTLTLGGSTTGDIALSPANAGGGVNVNVGATRSLNVLAGNLKVGNGNPDVSLNGEDAYIEGTLEVDSASRFDSTVQISSLTTDGGVLYTNSSGVISQTTVGTGGQCLQSNGGGAPTWGSCTGGAVNYMRIVSGAISPVNDTVDFLVGNVASTSAKFAVLNVNSGTPTASLSAGVAGGAYLSATGTLQTTANQALAIGGNTTGDISFSPLNGTGTSTFTGNLTQSGGIVNLNVSSNNAVNIGTGSSTGTVTVGGTGTQTISVGNGAGNKTVNLGSNNSGSTTAILSGTGGLSLNSTSSNIALQTNTSGDITATTAVGTGLFNVLTGNLKVGNGAPTTAQDGEDAYIEGMFEVDGAVRFDNSSITMSTFTQNGGILYTNGSGVLAQTTAGSAGQCLQGGTTPSFVSCTSISSYWRLASGALSPINDTTDLLVGSNATTSAKFAVINVNSGTPTASLSAGAAGGAYLTAAGTLQTTANQALAIGGATTGDISFSPLNGTGTSTFTGNLTQSGGIVNLNVSSNNAVNIGTGSSTGTVTVGGTGTQTISLGNGAGNKTVNLGSNNTGSTTAILSGTGGLSLNSTSSNIALQTNTSGDITETTAASTGLVNVLTGNLKVGNGAPTTTLSGESAYIEGGLEVDGAIRFDNSSITMSTFTQNGGILYTNGSGVLAQTTAGSAGQCLQGGTTPSFVTCTSIGSYWRLASGALSPINDTTDLLVGSNATTSAKFAVINVNSGTPTATLSAGAAGGAYLTAAGSLQTTANQTLTVGGSTTGDITLSPLNGSGGINANLGATRLFNVLGGNLKVGNGTPDVTQDGEDAYIEGTLEVDGAVRFDNSAVRLSAFTTNGGLLYTDGSGNIGQSSAGLAGQCLVSNGSGAPSWTSCSSAASNFWRIANGAISPINDTLDFLIGNTATTSAKFAVINVNSGTPTATLSAGAAGGAYLSATGSLQTTANQTLTLGGSTTGDITISPRNAGGIVNINAANIVVANNGVLNAGGAASTAYNFFAGSTSTNSTAADDNDLYIEDKLEVDGAVRFDNSSITMSTFTQNGGILYTNGSGVLAQTTAGSAGQCLQGGTTPSFVTCTSIGSNWRLNAGTISPNNDTLDVLFGANSTASAKFAFLNVNTGTPTASISANASGNGLVLAGNGAIQSLRNNTLTIGGSTTGDITISPRNAAGILNINAANIVVANNGVLNAGGAASTAYNFFAGSTATNTTAADDNDLYIEDKLEVDGAVRFDNSSITMSTFTNNGGILYTNASGVLAQTAVGNSGECLTSVGGGTPVWASCSAASGNYWRLNAGTISPVNDTFDLLVGANSTASAKFAVLNVNTGTPTASISANSNGNGLVLAGNGAIQSLRNNTLTLGGSTTGDITISPRNAAGILNINASNIVVANNGVLNAGGAASTAYNFFAGSTATNTTAADDNDLYIEDKLEVDGAVRFDNSSITMSTFTQNGGILYTNGSGVLAQTTAGSAGQCLQGGTTPSFVTCTSIGSNWRLNAGTISPNNDTLDLLIGANATTSAKFAVINVNSGTPTASLSAGTAGGAYLTATGSLQTTANQSLTLGGSTTGNITISPKSGAGAITLDENTITTTNGVTLNANALTTGAAFIIPHTTSVIANGGSLMRLSSTSADTSTTTGALLDLSSSASTAGTQFLQTYSGLTTGIADSLVLNALTTGTGIGVTSSSTGITAAAVNTGSLFDITESGAMSGLTGSIASINASGANTVGSTGNLLNLNVAGSAQIMKVLNITDATTGALTNGAVRVNMTGAHTGNAVEIDDVTTTGRALQITDTAAYTGTGLVALTADSATSGVLSTISGNALTTGTGFGITSSSTGLSAAAVNTGSLFDITESGAMTGMTGSLASINASGANTVGSTGNLLNLNVSGSAQIMKVLNITDATTGALVNGAVRLNMTGAHTGNALQIDDVTTTGNAMQITASSLTSGNALSITGSTAQTTGASLAVTNGRVSFTPTNTIASGASAVWNGVTIPATTATLTGTTQVTTSTGFNLFNIGQPTLTDGSAVTVDNAATLYIANAPAAAGSVTLTNPYALWIDAGALRFDGALNVNGSVGTGSQCLLGGATPAWGACGSSSGSNWRITNGALSPINDTLDLLVGNTATTSAKFAVINVNSGTPTATLSAGVAGGAYLTATGTLQTTANQSLTLGGSTTGNISLSPKSGAGAITLDENTITTTNGVTLNANALTTGAAFIIPHTTSVIANGGSLMRLSSTSVDTSTTTGALLDLSSSASTAGTQILQTYSGLTTGIGESMVVNALTTGTGLGITSSSTGLSSAAVNTGSLFDITESGAMTGMTGSLASINASGANTVGSTGNLLNLNVSGSAQIMKVLNIVDATTGALVNGAVRLNMTGAHTGNALQIDDVTTTGKVELITANSLTTGTGLGISSSATGITTAASNTGSLFDITASGANTGITGSIASINASSVNNVGNTGNLLNLNLAGAANIMKALNIADNSTGALTGGGIFLNMTGAHTGTAAEIDDVTTTGTLFKLANSASGQTTDKFIDISQTGVTTGYTGNLINLSTTGTTGAATFINMTADASTVGTGEKISMNALTTGTIYSGATSSTAITTAGSNVGSLLDLTASGAMTAFTGSLANINVANANNVGDTGNALNINLGSAAQIMKAVNITDATTGALTNGAFRLNMTGAHTGNGMEIDDVTTTGTAFQLTGTGVYTGTAFAGITQDAATTGTVFLMSEDGLTSGTGFSNTSTSTVLTSGKLASFDWSPPASTTIYATTGSALLNLNVGQYGVIDKILNASDNASDVFTVRQTKITNALPTEFTAAGDVSVAYDIQMTNQTASTIKSNAGLTVQAGESFENNNLTLSTYGTGQITLDGSFNGGAVTDAATVSTSGTTRTVSGRGSVYYLSADSTTTDLSITTTFNITGVPDTNGTVIFISSRAIKGVTAGVRQDTVNININGTSLSSVQTASGTAASTVIENYVAARMNGTWRIVGSTGTADSADYAEFYKVTQQLESGSIVALSPTDPTTVNEATSADGSRTIGITSTSPAYNIGDEWQDQQKAPIALAGRVPVRISANSQAIKIGDPIAASDLAGQGTKATRAGFIVGRALEDWTPGSGVDRINVFVNPVYYDPGYLVDEVGNIQDRTTALEAKLAENTDIMNKISSPAYDSNGQATNNFSIVNVGGIFQIVTNSTNTVVNQLIAGSRAVFGQLEAGTIKTNSVKTSLISPISSEDLTLKLGTEASSKLSVKNASDEAILNIDQQGNTDIAGNVTTQGNLDVAKDASVEGQVTATSGRFQQLQAQKATLENLDVQSATISGQLYLSDGRSIQGIIDDNSAYLASISAQTQAITQQVQSAPQALTTSSFDQFLSQLTGSQDASVSAAINALAQQQNISLQSTDMVLAPDAVFVKEFLNVAGYAQFNNAGVSSSLTIGNNLLLTQDSIASAGQTLNIQPTATNSVNILAGLLVLNPDGNVVLNGNLVVSGDVKVGQKLNTNAIQPNDYSSDFTLKLATQSAVLGASTESKFSILDASNGSVASIDASGSARFNDVSASGLTIQNPTLSATDSASIAEKAKNQTVGSNTLPAGTTELTIDNNNVNDNVLIYLTPTSDTANQVVYLKSKETCNGPLSLASCQKSFTVSIKNAVTQDISFNYWIVKTK